MVEAALALPLLLFLFMGMLQLIALGWAAVLSTHAVHAAARVYSVRHADDEKMAARLAQDTAERILAKAWPAAIPHIEIEEASAGTCHLRLTTLLTPLWGWRWALTLGGLNLLERETFIQDEATEARRTEDEFKPVR